MKLWPFRKQQVSYAPLPLKETADSSVPEERGRSTKCGSTYLWSHVRLLILIFTILACVYVGIFELSQPTTRRTDVIVESKDEEPSSSGPPSLHLIGERHSGTNWMFNHLEECFGQDVAVSSALFRWKHWFQEDVDYALFDDNKRLEHAVVVAQFRNPYHWVEAMRIKPYHSPMHFYLPWKEFVTAPWYMPRFGKDQVFDQNITSTEPPCLINNQKWQPREVIPCIEQDKVPNIRGKMIHAIYELRHDGSGLPYDSLLELRADKIRNHLDVAKFADVNDFYQVQYDQMARNGTEALIRSLEVSLGVSAKCKPLPPHQPSSYTLAPKFIDWMKAHVDWEAEKLIGYYPNMH